MPIQKAKEGSPYGHAVNTPKEVETSDGRPSVSFSVSKVYTKANVPAASSGNTSLIIWIVDEEIGRQLQFSDGTSWVPILY